jgi:hypothetical protein
MEIGTVTTQLHHRKPPWKNANGLQHAIERQRTSKQQRKEENTLPAALLATISTDDAEE